MSHPPPPHLVVCSYAFPRLAHNCYGRVMADSSLLYGAEGLSDAMQSAWLSIQKRSPPTISWTKWPVQSSEVQGLDYVDSVGSGTTIPYLLTISEQRSLQLWGVYVSLESTCRRSFMCDASKTT